MEHKEWLEKYSRLKEASERIEAMRLKRYRDLLRASHVENTMTLHNAMVGLHYGKPWAGVDYSVAKLAYYLDQSGWLYYPARVVTRWDARARGYNAPEYITRQQTWKVDRRILELHIDSK